QRRTPRIEPGGSAREPGARHPVDAVGKEDARQRAAVLPGDPARLPRRGEPRPPGRRGVLRPGEEEAQAEEVGERVLRVREGREVEGRGRVEAEGGAGQVEIALVG